MLAVLTAADVTEKGSAPLLLETGGTPLELLATLGYTFEVKVKLVEAVTLAEVTAEDTDDSERLGRADVDGVIIGAVAFETRAEEGVDMLGVVLRVVPAADPGMDVALNVWKTVTLELAGLETDEASKEDNPAELVPELCVELRNGDTVG